MKTTLVAAMATMTVIPAMAGGLTTNTNQNAAFLRQLSQEAIIDITGVYMNPAGTAFLTSGSHLSLNIQNAKQNRDIQTTYPLMALNSQFPSPTRQYNGVADAPVIPSLQYSYNWEKWSLFGNFALGGGGGKCEFDNGLGTFESLYATQLYALIPQAVNAQLAQVLPTQVAQQLQMAGMPAQYATMLANGTQYDSRMTSYSLNAYMKGRSYQFGLTIGGTYRLMDNLSLALALRTVYATNNYNGWVEDIKATYSYNYSVPANEQLGFPGKSGESTGEQSLDNYALSLNADQDGWGFTPIVGVDWKINDQWNVAVKYELKTRLRLKNKTEMNAYTAQAAASNATLGQFADGATIPSDIPSFLSAGVQYSPIQALRLQAGFHYYGDKSATQYGNKQDLIDDNTLEFTAGIEWDLCKWVTLSGGWQKTQYGLSDAYMNDLSFVTNSQSFGFGARVRVTSRCNIDLGYMKTLYDNRVVTTENFLGSSLQKTDDYSRTNRVLGLGVNFQF